MDTVLAGLLLMAVYLDDILIATKTTEEHYKVLAKVPTRLAKAGLHENSSKCVFYSDSLEFSVHQIDSHDIYPSQAKVQAIHQVPAPTYKNYKHFYVW